MNIARQAASNVSRRSFATTANTRVELLPKSNSPIVSKLSFFNSVTGDGTQIPTYRVLDGSGKPLDGAELPEVSLLCYHEKPSFNQSP